MTHPTTSMPSLSPIALSHDQSLFLSNHDTDTSQKIIATIGEEHQINIVDSGVHPVIPKLSPSQITSFTVPLCLVAIVSLGVFALEKMRQGRISIDVNVTPGGIRLQTNMEKGESNPAQDNHDGEEAQSK